jgi:hypothetical protein
MGELKAELLKRMGELKVGRCLDAWMLGGLKVT